MGLKGVIYERELKIILEDPNKNKIPFKILRSSGSLNIDLFAIHPLFSFIIEVKKVKGDIFYFTNTKVTKKQYEEIIELSQKYNQICLYAIKFVTDKKRKGWRVFLINETNNAFINELFKFEYNKEVKLTSEKGIELKEFILKINERTI